MERVKETTRKIMDSVAYPLVSGMERKVRIMCVDDRGHESVLDN